MIIIKGISKPIFAKRDDAALVERFEPEYTSTENISDALRVLTNVLGFLNWIAIFVCCEYYIAAPVIVMLTLIVLSFVARWMVENVRLLPFYEADEKAVVFHENMKKISIDYNDISGICVQQYSRSLPEGGISYIERLSILTEDDIFVFDANVYTDPDAVSSDFGSMQERFDDAPLSRLKKYILYNRSQFISGNRIETDPKLLALQEIECSLDNKR